MTSHSLVTADRAVTIGAHRLEGLLAVPANPIGLIIFAHGSGSSRFSPRNNLVAGEFHAPLVNGHAILLRQLADRGSLKFDAVVFLNLSGYGIRALARASDGEIWGIGGTSADSDEKHTLWRFSKDELKPGATINPKQVAVLPTSSEGLAIFNGKAIVVVDGSQSEHTASDCAVDSQILVVDLDR